jgi:hypothetical protein
MDDYDKKWLARIMARTERLESGCIVWTGTVNYRGYGTALYRGRTWNIHRVVFQLSTGVTLGRWEYACHTCDVPACVNIEHLWKGTPQQNAADRSAKGRGYWETRTHCPAGHEYNEENTYILRSKRGRGCRICQRTQQRIRAGWTPEQAAMPVVAKGSRPVNAGWASRRAK